MFAGPLGRSTFTPPKSSFDSPLYGLVSLRRSHCRTWRHQYVIQRDTFRKEPNQITWLPSCKDGNARLPYRAVIHPEAAQGERGFDPLQEPGLMIPDDLARARPADLRRGATAGCPQTLRPLHNARRCHLQRHGHLPDTLPFGPPRQRAFAQIHRNRTGHRSSFPCRRHDSESTQAEQRNPHTIQIESSRSRRCSRPQPSCLRFRRCPLEDRTAPRRHPRAHQNPAGTEIPWPRLGSKPGKSAG